MRFLIVLIITVLCGLGSASAAVEVSQRQRAELEAYIGKVRVLLHGSLHRLPPPGSGTVTVRIEVLKSGAIRLVDMKGGTEALREFVRVNLLLTRYPSPPRWVPVPLKIGVPVTFREEPSLPGPVLDYVGKVRAALQGAIPMPPDGVAQKIEAIISISRTGSVSEVRFVGGRKTTQDYLRRIFLATRLPAIPPGLKAPIKLGVPIGIYPRS